MTLPSLTTLMHLLLYIVHSHSTSFEISSNNICVYRFNTVEEVNLAASMKRSLQGGALMWSRMDAVPCEIQTHVVSFVYGGTLHSICSHDTT